MEVRAAHNLDWEKILELRYKALRQPWSQSKESATDELEAQSLNAVLFDEAGSLLACGRLHEVQPGLAQIRYMAVEENQRGKGHGKKVCEFLENAARKKGCKKIILQARENALEFYKNNGYRVVEKTFLLWGQVQHYLMEKEL